MFERFTESARQVIVLAQEEARGLNHGYIGTEHLLLGLIRENGRAATTLKSHGVALEPTRDWVARVVGRGQEEPPPGQLPLTPRLRWILETSPAEAERLGQGAIGTQHLLIALLHEGQGAALRALDDLGAPPQEVWVSAFRQLGADAPPYVRAGLPSAAEEQRETRPLGERVQTVVFAASGISLLVGIFLGWLIWG
jgi:ATP-dependent Clp protease ATP-binding subunit ClpA